MFRLIVFLVSHGLAMAAGFALGVYLLPILTAPEAPTDAEIACPDPHCGGRFRVTRTGKRVFRHSGTTGLPEERGTAYWKVTE